MDAWLSEHLVCPRDYSHLRQRADTLVCESAHTYLYYVDGIPVMLTRDLAPTNRHLWDLAEAAAQCARSRTASDRAGSAWMGISAWAFKADLDLMPPHYKAIIRASEVLRGLSGRQGLGWMTWLG